MIKSNFRWWYFIVGYFAYLLAIFINSFFINGTQFLFQEASFASAKLYNVTQFVFAGLICLLLIKMVSKNKLTKEEFGIHFKSFFKVISIGSILGFVFYAISSIAEVYDEELRKGGEEVIKSLNLGNNFKDDILILLSIGFFAPVVEEIIFRGAIFNPIIQGLRKFKNIPNWLTLLIGIVVSTLAFTSIHGGGGQDAQMIFLALLGVITALSFYFTKSIFAPIFVHAINNNIIFILVIYHSVGLNSLYGISLVLLSLMCIVACVPLTILFGKLLSAKKS